jgi:hypothetical protein
MAPHPSIPPEVAVDLREAALCFSIGAWNACTTMCRRSLQSCAKNKGANPKDDLFGQLQELRDRDIIPAVLYDVADAIRKKGNIGAHPGRDPVLNTQVSEAEARAVFRIIEQVYKYVYEYPDDVTKLNQP